MPPTIFICPGLWEGPGVFEPLAKILQEDGFKVHTTKLISTGTSPPGNPNMQDDAAAIAKDLATVVESAGPEGVIAVLHSAGGFLGSEAMKDLTRTAGKENGRDGGVSKIVFLCSGIGPPGMEHKPQPFMEFDESTGTHTCRDGKNSLFHDLPPDQAELWWSKMQHQPADWDSTITYCGWRDIPSVYVLTEEDRLLPPAAQEKMAEMAGSKLLRVKSGHMLMLSKTKEVATIIKEVALGLL